MLVVAILLTPSRGLPAVAHEFDVCVFVCRDSRRFVWAIDGWSDKRRQKAVRSPHFGLAGSERTWSLSYTSDKAGFHLTCVGDPLPHPPDARPQRWSEWPPRAFAWLS